MLHATGRPPGWRDLDDQSPAAGCAVAGRLQCTQPRALSVRTLGGRLAAAITVGCGEIPGVHGHSVFDSALIGILSSASMARSSSAGRPSVVR
jgi:hypothetical protein